MRLRLLTAATNGPILHPPCECINVEDHGGMISTGELLIRSTELFGDPTSSHLVAEHKDLAKAMNLAVRSIFVHTSMGFLTYRQVLRHGADFTSPPKEGVLRLFIALGRV
jgi:hypothetical protein